MAEFPALPLFTDAYLGDTTHLSTFEHGAYLLLLIVSWRSPGCCIPDDDRLLARYARTTRDKWRKTRPVLEPFFDIVDGQWHQARLQDELQHLRSQREARSKAGIAGNEAKALKRKKRRAAKGDAMRSQDDRKQDAPLPTPINVLDSSESNTGDSAFAAPQPAWEEFARFRRRIGKPLTEHAVKLALGKLEKLQADGHDPTKVLEQSILNGWAGVFPLKEESRNERSNGAGDDGQSGANAVRNPVLRAIVGGLAGSTPDE